MTDRTFDPATFEVVKNSLSKIAEEMKIVLAKDGLFADPEGRRRLFLRRV